VVWLYLLLLLTPFKFFYNFYNKRFLNNLQLSLKRKSNAYCSSVNCTKSL
jgi:hypothetical protein